MNSFINFFCFFILCKNASIRWAIIYKSRKMLKRAADSPWDTEFIVLFCILLILPYMVILLLNICILSTLYKLFTIKIVQVVW